MWSVGRGSDCMGAGLAHGLWGVVPLSVTRTAPLQLRYAACGAIQVLYSFVFDGIVGTFFDMFLSASGPKLPSCCIYSVLRGCAPSYFARSPTSPTFQVAEDFALPAATAASSLRFTAPLLAAEHFRLLAPKCGTACHRKLRRHRLWRPSALDSRRFCLLNHILTFG